LVFTDNKGVSNTIDLGVLVAANTTNTLRLVNNELTSTVNGVASTVTITDANIASGKNITGTGITVGNGNGSALKDVTLAITPGTANQVLVTNTSGNGTTWVDQSVISPTTTNILTSNGNTITSNVNGVSDDAAIINSVANSLDVDNKLITNVNGVSGTGVDLTPAIQAGQNNTVVSQGTGITVTPNTSGKTTTYTVAANPAEITLNGDVTGTANATKVVKIQGTSVSTTAPSAAGQALVYNNTSNQWEPGTPKIDAGNVTDRKDLTATTGDNSITVTNGTGTTLVNTQLHVTNNGITTEKLADNAVTTGKIINGTVLAEDLNPNIAGDGLVLNTANNRLDVEAESGVEIHDDKVKLGGNLTRATTITQNGNPFTIATGGSNFNITGLDKTKVQATVNTGTGVTDYLLAVGVGDKVKALKAAMPKFFYMPSVLVPTAESQLGQTGVTFNNATRTGTIDLYSIYVAQFGSPVMSSAGAAPLPVLPAGELGFHVTYATSNVFTINSITAAGLMTYTVSSTADISNGSFINIVFSVNED